MWSSVLPFYFMATHTNSSFLDFHVSPISLSAQHDFFFLFICLLGNFSLMMFKAERGGAPVKAEEVSEPLCSGVFHHCSCYHSDCQQAHLERHSPHLSRGLKAEGKLRKGMNVFLIWRCCAALQPEDWRVRGTQVFGAWDQDGFRFLIISWSECVYCYACCSDS